MKKVINPVEVLKESIQWMVFHRKTMIVIFLSYLGIDKILEDMAFYTISYGTYTGTAKQFFSTLLVDALVYIGMIILVFLIVCVVSITLDHRPLTMNAISLYMRRNTRGVVMTIAIMVACSLLGKLVFHMIVAAIGIDSLYMLWVIEAFLMVGLLFAFVPHELMIEVQGGFRAVANSLKTTTRYYGKLFTLHIFIAFLYLMNVALIDWLFGGFPLQAMTAVNDYLFVGVNCIALTIFYHKIIRD